MTTAGPCAALIVEDDENVQNLLRSILRRHCTIVDVAADGETAMAMLGEKAYDVVTLDLMLPKVNGFAVAGAIARLQKPPRIIVLSALARHFADRFPPDTIVLQKPFDLDRLDEVLFSLVGSS